MRRTTSATIWVTLLLVALAACTDLREFRGQWRGPRVGASPSLAVGVGSNASATLVIDALDQHGLTGALSVDGLADAADVTSLAGAEADALASLTFTGSPLRVYLAFVDTTDGGGQALAVIALFDDRRVEVRLLRGGAQPIYAIFALVEDVGS